jgi:hypothetical protein
VCSPHGQTNRTLYQIMLKLDVEETDPTVDEEGPHGHWFARVRIKVDEFVRDDNGSIFHLKEGVSKVCFNN